MFKKLLTVAVCVCATFSMSFGQRQCHTMEVLDRQIAEDPSIVERMDAIEEHTNRFIDRLEKLGDAALTQVGATEVITIPVVVHVVYNNSTENISTSQINSQIDILNDDFRKLNALAGTGPYGSRAADSYIQFELATTDPNGNPSSGITRTSTTRSSFSTNNTVKFNSQGGKNAWPSDEYLNMWVCDISGGILGYAQFPGGPANTDGVVMDYQYFGDEGTATAPFNLGRTATHEVGHWLNLRHIWGDGGCGVDDFVSDTPVSSAPNYGCPGTVTRCGSQDMTMNYMDYVNDACMYMFSQGQVNRMRATFENGGGRSSFASGSSGGGPGTGGGTPPASYCDSRGNSTRDEWIGSVTLNGVTNNSGNNGGYGNFTGTPINATAGGAFPITIVPTWAGTVYPEGYAIWLDKNQDGDFSDPGERIGATGSAITASSVSGTLTIPADALNGQTRLRVSMKYNGVPTACETFSFGEVEDYTVNISNGLRNDNAPEVARSTVEVYPNPANATATVSFSVDMASDIAIQLIDARGTIVEQTEIVGATGTILHNIDVSNLKQGVYFVSIKGAALNEVKRLMVTK